MKRALIIFTIATLSVGAVAGCAPKKTDTVQVNLDPDFNEPSADEAELDFIELNNATIDGFGSVAESPYTFITDVSVDGDNNEKNITVSVKAVDGVDEEDAKHFTSALLRHMDDAAADQYSAFEASTDKSFGNLYDTYAVEVVVTSEKDGSEIYRLTKAPGDEIELDPDIESYEEEWAEYGELMLKGIEDENALEESEEAEAQSEGSAE